MGKRPYGRWKIQSTFPLGSSYPDHLSRGPPWPQDSIKGLSHWHPAPFGNIKSQPSGVIAMHVRTSLLSLMSSWHDAPGFILGPLSIRSWFNHILLPILPTLRLCFQHLWWVYQWVYGGDHEKQRTKGRRSQPQEACLSQPAISFIQLEHLGGSLISFAFPLQWSGTSAEYRLGAMFVTIHLRENLV